MSTHITTAIQCLRDEAQGILDLVPRIDETFSKAIDLILATSGNLIFLGVGKSGHVAKKIAATLASTGTKAFYINPTDAYHGDLGNIGSQDTCVAISNSGETEELIRLLPNLLQQGTPIIGMSSKNDSLLARNSTIHLNIAIEREACPMRLAPTTSTTVTMALGDAMACALMVAREFKDSDFAQFHPGGSLGKRLLTRAKDVMRCEALPCVNPHTSIAHTLMVMTTGRLGLCVVVENDKVVGIVTDGDLRRAMERSGEDFFRYTAADLMTQQPKSVAPDAMVSHIEQLMQQYKIHSILVVDETQKLMGIVDSFATML